MKTWLIVVIVIVALLVVFVLWLVGVYNKLVIARNKVKNSWGQIDVQLKRRFDLIPNLIETVKGFAAQEKSILGDFAKARTMFSKAESAPEMAEADGALTKTLGRLIAVSEAYPELKSDTHFAKMMDELRDTENKISFTRQFYNDVVLSFNNTIQVFPNVIIAGMFNFKAEQFFKVMDEEKAAPQVKF